MLPEQHRTVLINSMLGVFLAPLDCRNFVNAVRMGSWEATVPMDAAFANAVPLLVDAADGQNWLRELVKALADKFAARAEFTTILAVIDRPATAKTNPDPFKEVLLDAGRPFVDRTSLRTQLLDLTSGGGSSVLRIDGGPKTGKTFSYYLINHVAPTKGFAVSKFEMNTLPKPDELAGDILRRMAAVETLPPMGVESAQRWAEKLTDIVAGAIVAKNKQRLFVFDEFKDTALPEGTPSLIIRLARYADEELRPYLRVVLVHFRDELSSEVEDVALRDAAVPFTNTDMLSAVMQVAGARAWTVTPNVVQAKIDEFDPAARRTLKDRFNWLRKLLQELAQAAP